MHARTHTRAQYTCSSRTEHTYTLILPVPISLFGVGRVQPAHDLFGEHMLRVIKANCNGRLAQFARVVGGDQVPIANFRERWAEIFGHYKQKEDSRHHKINKLIHRSKTVLNCWNCCNYSHWSVKRPTFKLQWPRSGKAKCMNHTCT